MDSDDFEVVPASPDYDVRDADMWDADGEDEDDVKAGSTMSWFCLPICAISFDMLHRTWAIHCRSYYNRSAVGQSRED